MILGFLCFYELLGVDVLLRLNKSVGEIGVVGFGDALIVGEIIVVFIVMGGVLFSVNFENKFNLLFVIVVVVCGVFMIF